MREETGGVVPWRSALRGGRAGEGCELVERLRPVMGVGGWMGEGR